MKYVHIIAILAVVQFVVFSFLVTLARQKYGVKAPAIGGHDEFERVYRVQMNTLEQLVCFLPALFLAAHYWSPIFAAVAGVIYLIGRLVYRQSYISDPSTRSLGFLLTIIPTFVLLAAALLGAVVS